jgi:hypothetical protein
MVGTEKWAISSNYKYARAHIWIESMSDTMCGLRVGNRFTVVSERGAHKICRICLNNLLMIQDVEIARGVAKLRH